MLGVEAQHIACTAMLAELHRGHTADDERIDVVVTVDVDRIYKTPVQWERFITAFRAFPARAFLVWQGPRDLYGPDADESGLRDVSVAMGEIREAVAACVAGQTLGAITRIFARSGLPTRNGGPWRTQTVKQIISSPRLTGLRVLDDEIVADEAGNPLAGRWDTESALIDVSGRGR